MSSIGAVVHPGLHGQGIAKPSLPIGIDINVCGNVASICNKGYGSVACIIGHSHLHNYSQTKRKNEEHGGNKVSSQAALPIRAMVEFSTLGCQVPYLTGVSGTCSTTYASAFPMPYTVWQILLVCTTVLTLLVAITQTLRFIVAYQNSRSNFQVTLHAQLVLLIGVRLGVVCDPLRYGDIVPLKVYLFLDDLSAFLLFTLVTSLVFLWISLASIYDSSKPSSFTAIKLMIHGISTTVFLLPYTLFYSFSLHYWQYLILRYAVLTMFSLLILYPTVSYGLETLNEMSRASLSMSTPTRASPLSRQRTSLKRLLFITCSVLLTSLIWCVCRLAYTIKHKPVLYSSTVELDILTTSGEVLVAHIPSLIHILFTASVLGMFSRVTVDRSSTRSPPA